MTTEHHQSIRGRYAARILDYSLRERLNPPTRGGPRRKGRDLPELPELQDEPIPRGPGRADPPLPPGKIGIVGAGVAGLYLAMMCDYLELEYEILESSDRVGGRVFTYQFPERGPKIVHNYYDVGAMRFPILATMKPVKNLIDHLKVPTAKYILSNSDAPNLFVNKKVTSEEINTNLKPLEDAILPLVKALTEDFDTGFQILMLTDIYSTRQYLSTQLGEGKNMTFAEIQKLETFDTSTGLFDQAFSETVLDYFDFNAADDWYRIEGGTSVLTDAMHNSIKYKAKLNSRVNRISYDGQDSVAVYLKGDIAPRTYNTVFNTTTMGCLGQMDTSRLGLSDDQQIAIRSLSYDRSCKVAIKFSNAWWTKLPGGLKPGSGGSSATDLPIRTTVYPSWVDGNADEPVVLIATYTWALDATKLGSLILSPTDPIKNAELLDVILNNLVRLYNYDISYDSLKSLVMDHHAYAWSHDPNTAGAFALFGAGQFTNLYPEVLKSAANGHFYMVGECVSAHHAWIVGALDSAYGQLYEFLFRFKQTERRQRLKDSWFGGGQGLHPDEFIEKLAKWNLKLSLNDRDEV